MNKGSYVPRTGDILTVSAPTQRGNAKGDKASELGIVTCFCQLEPHTLGGVKTVCPYATPECMKACLNYSGRNVFDLATQARQNRTDLFHNDRPEFVSRTDKQFLRVRTKAERDGYEVVNRMNATSDLAWERIRWGEHANIMEAYPEMQWYDYTKYPVHYRLDNKKYPFPANYHLTYSYAGNMERVREALDHDVNVAVVFYCEDTSCTNCRYGKGAVPTRYSCKPTVWNGVPVFDGDETDLRYLDPVGVIVGLSLKQTYKRYVKKGGKVGYRLDVPPRTQEQEFIVRHDGMKN